MRGYDPNQPDPKWINATGSTLHRFGVYGGNAGKYYTPVSVRTALQNARAYGSSYRVDRERLQALHPGETHFVPSPGMPDTGMMFVATVPGEKPLRKPVLSA